MVVRGSVVAAVLALAAASVLFGLAGTTFLSKKSMAAVVAAERIAAAPPSGALCLSQAWAYGGGLYLRGVGIRDLPYPLAAGALARAVDECSLVGLFEEDYRRDGGLAALLEQHRFQPSGEARWGRGRAVFLFRRGGSTP